MPRDGHATLELAPCACLRVPGLVLVYGWRAPALTALNTKLLRCTHTALPHAVPPAYSCKIPYTSLWREGSHCPSDGMQASIMYMPASHHMVWWARTFHGRAHISLGTGQLDWLGSAGRPPSLTAWLTTPDTGKILQHYRRLVCLGPFTSPLHTVVRWQRLHHHWDESLPGAAASRVSHPPPGRGDHGLVCRSIWQAWRDERAQHNTLHNRRLLAPVGRPHVGDIPTALSQ